MEKIKTTVHIAGREYAISSYDSEEYIQSVAAWVDLVRKIQKGKALKGGMRGKYRRGQHGGLAAHRGQYGHSHAQRAAADAGQILDHGDAFGH